MGKKSGKILHGNTEKKVHREIEERSDNFEYFSFIGTIIIRSDGFRGKYW